MGRDCRVGTGEQAAKPCRGQQAKTAGPLDPPNPETSMLTCGSRAAFSLLHRARPRVGQLRRLDIELCLNGPLARLGRRLVGRLVPRHAH